MAPVRTQVGLQVTCILLLNILISRVNGQCEATDIMLTMIPFSTNDIVDVTAGAGTATVTCDAGYEPPTIGLTCEALATTWTRDPVDAVCADIDECATAPCGASGVCLNAAGGYTCICGDAYAWDDVALACVETQCGPPGDFEHAYYPPTNLTNSIMLMTLVTVTCDFGWEVSAGVTTFDMMCSVAGWSDPEPCIDIDECALDPLSCGPTGICVNTIGSYYCLCSSGENWAGDLATGVCAPPVAVDECTDADICRPEGICINTDLAYYCVCPPFLKWIGDLATGMCVREVTDCGDPGDDENAHHLPTPSRLTIAGEPAIQYDCDVGYYIRGQSPSSRRYQKACQLDFTWSEGETCIDVDECNVVGSVCTGPNQVCQNTLGSFNCLCKEGYEWLDEPTEPFGGECKPVLCDDPPNMNNVEVLPRLRDEYPYNLEVEFRCKPGFCPSYDIDKKQITDRITFACNSDSRWQPLWHPQCTRISCGFPGSKPHASMSASGFLYEDEVRYTCFDGFTSPGPEPGVITTRCEEDGEWSLIGNCQDINECREQSGICGDEIHTCINFPGSYDCSCAYGYGKDSDHKCTLKPLLDIGDGVIVTSGCDFFNRLGLCGNNLCTISQWGHPICQCPNGESGPFCDKDRDASLIIAIVALVISCIVLVAIVLMCCGVLCYRRPLGHAHGHAPHHQHLPPHPPVPPHAHGPRWMPFTRHRSDGFHKGVGF